MILYKDFRTIFFPTSKIIKIALLSSFLALTFTNVVNRLSNGTFKPIKPINITIIIISIIWFIFELYSLNKTQKWNERIWEITLRKFFVTCKIKNEIKRLEFITMIENYQKELFLNKEKTKDFYKSITVNIILTSITSIFTIISVLLKENYASFIMKNIDSIIYIILSIVVPIIVTTVFVIYFIYRETKESFFFNKQAKIKIILDKLYQFNYIESQRTTLRKK